VKKESKTQVKRGVGKKEKRNVGGGKEISSFGFSVQNRPEGEGEGRERGKHP